MCKGARAGVGSMTTWKNFQEASVARKGDGISSPGKMLLMQHEVGKRCTFKNKQRKNMKNETIACLGSGLLSEF